MSVDFFYRHKAGTLLCLYLGLAILFLSLKIDPYVRGIKAVVWFFISPEFAGSGKFFNKLDDLGGRLFQLSRAEGENQILRQQNAFISKREVERLVLEEENNRLRVLLGLKEKVFTDGITAEVLGHDPREWFHSIILNKGSDDGVVLSAAVVVADVNQPHLVGRVIDVANTTSKVLLITDVESAVSAEIELKLDMGLLEGRNLPTVYLYYLSSQSKVAIGDDIVTAGLGGVFPPGILIGKVSSVNISENGFFKEAKVQPAVDFSSLREVMVLSRLTVPHYKNTP